MLQLLWLVPAIPFAGALLLAIFGPRMRAKAVAITGVETIGLSAAISLLIGAAFLSAPPPAGSYTQVLWTWIDVGPFRPEIAFYLDALSLVMMMVVTFVSFLIHLYSVEFMRGDEGYSRFFAYMNLFVASMVTLLLADNLLLFHSLGTLHIQDLMHAAQSQWPAGSPYAIAAAALLLGGAVGKSAQLPLQTWLPDAMAGPTPTSALIHAATMVTAGVYLIARTHVLYELAPPAQLAVAVVGAATLLVAGCAALTQNDIKRILAYSTV